MQFRNTVLEKKKKKKYSDRIGSKNLNSFCMLEIWCIRSYFFPAQMYIRIIVHCLMLGLGGIGQGIVKAD